MGILGSFFGSDQRRDIQRGDRRATAALDAGTALARPQFEGAIDAIQPFAESGLRSQTEADDLQGLNGPEAQAAAVARLQANPVFSGGVQTDSNALLRLLNARGQSGGGRAQLAGQRVLQENFGRVLDRFRQGGSQGLQAAGGVAGAQTNLGNFEFGLGATKAGQAINTANAIAGSRNIGVNNLLNLGGTIAKGASLFA